MDSIIYKIEAGDVWAAAIARGSYLGSAHDVRDGFVHFSRAVQAQATADKHFAGRLGLVVAAIDAARLGAALRWEPSRGGAVFPHLYGALPAAAVLWTKPLPLGADGRHVLPKEDM